MRGFAESLIATTGVADKVKVTQYEDTFTLGSTVLTTTISLNEPVDLTSTFLIFSFSTSGTEPRFMLTASFSDNETVEFKRTSGVASHSYNTTVYVVEWPGSLVQSFDTTISSGNASATATINAVDLSRTFVVGSLRSSTSGTSEGERNFVTEDLTSSTSLVLTRESTTDTVVRRSFVVELPSGNSVQKTSHSTTAATNAQTITAVDLNRTFVIGSSRCGAGGIDRTIFSTQFLSSTSLQVRRNTATGTLTAICYVVQIEPKVLEKVDLVGALTVTGLTGSKAADFNPNAFFFANHRTTNASNYTRFLVKFNLNFALQEVTMSRTNTSGSVIFDEGFAVSFKE